MKRRLLLILIGGIYLFLAVAPVQAIPLGGDPIYDGRINLSDIIFLINYIFKGGPAPQFPFMGTANEDCNTDLQDIMVLVNYIFKGGPEPKGWDCSFDTIIFTGLAGFSPFITYDGKRIYYTDAFDLVYSEWDSASGSWGPKINLGPNINTIEQESYPSLSIDGKKLYFTSYERPGGFGLRDIWVSEWDSVNSQWGVPANLGSDINSTNNDYASFISYDNSKLYFTDCRPDACTGIYASSWNGTGWDTAIALGSNVNFYGTERECSLTEDEKTIYFVRWWTDGFPKIFVSHWTGSNWGISLVLGPPVNLPGVGTVSPFIIPDGTALYFSSRGGQIWVAKKRY